MNIYLLTRTDGWTYDEHDSAVVYAETQEKAILFGMKYDFRKAHVKCEFLGEANGMVEEGEILASFNAG